MDLNTFFKEYVLNTNLFNFLILLAFFVFCAIRFDLSGKISDMQDKIASVIYDVKQNLFNSEKALNNAREAIKTLAQDIDKINAHAHKNAQIIADKILEDANIQANNIALNADKVISAEEKKVLDELIKEVSISSVAKSKENIVNMLQNNVEMHERYINESIDKLDGLTL